MWLTLATVLRDFNGPVDYTGDVTPTPGVDPRDFYNATQQRTKKTNC